MSKMFPFITHTHNLLKYCDYGCTYCWSKEKGFQTQEPTLYENRLSKRFKKGDFVFLNDCGDMMHPDIPDGHIEACYEFMRQSPEASFLLLTKNPSRYSTITPPPNAILGATIESDFSYPEISSAPKHFLRLNAMLWLRRTAPQFKLFISIEPIMGFTQDFASAIIAINPWAVAIGYDNYNHHLSEPSLSNTEKLIASLEAKGITVYQKTIRKAWWEAFWA